MKSRPAQKSGAVSPLARHSAIRVDHVSASAIPAVYLPSSGDPPDAAHAADTFTLIATARLHGLDPESYLSDLIRVLPHWPKDRYIELAPKHWAGTRARLVATELAAEIGDITVLEPITTATEEQTATN